MKRVTRWRWFAIAAAALVALAAVAAVVGAQRQPAAEGTWIAWVEWRDGNTKTSDLLAANLEDADAGPVILSDKGWRLLPALVGPVILSDKGWEETPALSEQHIVWANRKESDDSASLIYRRTLPGGVAAPVDARDARQHGPAAAGDWVVWLEDSEAKVKGALYSVDSLVAYNLSRSECRVLVEPVTDVKKLSISGERIVWIEHLGVGVDEDDYEVHTFDLATGKERVLRSYVRDPMPQSPHVSGRWAVWEEYHEWTDARDWWISVVSYDFTSGDLRTLPKDATSAVDDDWVVCSEGRRVSLLNLVSGERLQVASDAAECSEPQVRLPWVAWVERDLSQDSTGSVIRAVNVDTGEQRRFETPENQAEGIGLTITQE